MRRELPLLVFALVYPTLLSWVDFVVLASAGNTTNPAQQAAYVLGKLFQFVLPVAVVWWMDGRSPRPGRPRFDGMLGGLAFGLLTTAGMLLLYHTWLKGTPTFGATPDLVRQKLSEFGLTSLAAFVLFAVFLSIIHSLAEEYYWRWFVFGRLRGHISFTPAMLLSSLGFMSHHVIVLAVYLPGYFWVAVVPLSLCIAFGGAVWAWFYERTGTIWAAWLSHLVIDVAIMLIGYDMVYGVT
jgi:membrane protease YdiL (CAAX protease family)